MAVICGYRFVAGLKRLLFMQTPKSDPISFARGAFSRQQVGRHVDPEVLAQYLSLLLIAFLVINSMQNFILQLVKLFFAFGGGVTTDAGALHHGNGRSVFHLLRAPHPRTTLTERYRRPSPTPWARISNSDSTPNSTSSSSASAALTGLRATPRTSPPPPRTISPPPPPSPLFSPLKEDTRGASPPPFIQTSVTGASNQINNETKTSHATLRSPPSRASRLPLPRSLPRAFPSPSASATTIIQSNRCNLSFSIAPHHLVQNIFFFVYNYEITDQCV